MLIEALLALTGGALGVGALSIALPNPLRARERFGAPADFGLEVEQVGLPRDAVGWLVRHPTSEWLTIVCHGRSRARGHMLPVARDLSARTNVLLFDFPGHGEHGYGWTSIGARESRVVEGVVERAASLGFDRILLYGVSMGGAAVLLQLARGAGPGVAAAMVDGVFSDLVTLVDAQMRHARVPAALGRASLRLAGLLARYDPWSVRPVEAAAGIAVPLLVLHGDEDHLAPLEMGRAVAYAAGERGRLAVYSGGHDDAENSARAERINAFLDELDVPPALSAGP